MNEKTSRMVFATAALAAVAAVLAGPAGAQIPEGNGVQPVAAQSDERQAQSSGSVVVPYLSQGAGVAASQLAGTTSGQLTGVHAALANGNEGVSAASSESRTLGLSGDSPLSRVSAPEPEGLTGDSALTRAPESIQTPTVSGGEDFDWTSFGAGAGMVALVAAGLAGILLTARRRHTIGLP